MSKSFTANIIKQTEKKNWYFLKWFYCIFFSWIYFCAYLLQNSPKRKFKPLHQVEAKSAQWTFIISFTAIFRTLPLFYIFWLPLTIKVIRFCAVIKSRKPWRF